MSDCPAGYVKQDFDQGEVPFVLRGYDPLKNRYSKFWTRPQVQQEVITSPRLKTLIAELSNEEGIEREEYEKQVVDMVDEIGHKMNILSVKTVALLVRGSFRRVIKGIYVQKKGLEELRSAVTQWPVILLPSHRSYLDFLIITYFLLEFNIQIPAIAAGQDFMNMQFVSALLRRSGAFFLRRTFGSDRLYKLVFSLYTQAILCSGDAPVEFFIEGTRSRTAKSLHPKLGLLSMIIEPYLNGVLPDIMLFPLSISYEKTFEEDLFAREMLGIPKPKESTTGLMRARSLLSSDYGRVFVNISSPISLHNMCQKWGISRIPHGLYPRDAFSMTSKEREMVTKLGYFILEKINNGLKVFPTAIVAAVLLQYPLGIEKDELVRKVMWLRRETELRGAQVEWMEAEPVTVVENTLTLLSCNLSHDTKPVTVNVTIPDDSTARRDDDLSPERKKDIMDASFPYLKLTHYRNQLLHWFVPESMFLLCIIGCHEMKLSEISRLFGTLSNALSREFVLPQIPTDLLFVNTFRALLDRRLIGKRMNGNEPVVFLRDDEKYQAAHFIARLVQPFVAGVWVMCQYLDSLQGGVQTMKSTFKNSQTLAAKFLNTGILTTYEPLSLDMLKNVMASLNSAGLILQLELEFEGYGRLVKVAQNSKFEEFIQDIEFVLFSKNAKPLLPENRLSKL